MVVREGQVGGMAVVEDPVDPPVAQVAGRGFSTGRVCWNGARKVVEGVPTLEGSAGRVRWKGFER